MDKKELLEWLAVIAYWIGYAAMLAIVSYYLYYQ